GCHVAGDSRTDEIELVAKTREDAAAIGSGTVVVDRGGDDARRAPAAEIHAAAAEAAVTRGAVAGDFAADDGEDVDKAAEAAALLGGYVVANGRAGDDDLAFVHIDATACAPAGVAG